MLKKFWFYSVLSFGFIVCHAEGCIMLVPIMLPILSQACVFFKGASLAASNNVKTCHLPEFENRCNIFFLDGHPACLSRHESPLAHCSSRGHNTVSCTREQMQLTQSSVAGKPW